MTPDLLEVGVPGGPASPEEDQVDEDQEGEPGQGASPQPQLGGEEGVEDLGQCLLVTHLMLSTVLTLKVRTGRSQSADCRPTNALAQDQHSDETQGNGPAGRYTWFKLDRNVDIPVYNQVSNSILPAIFIIDGGL